MGKFLKNITKGIPLVGSVVGGVMDMLTPQMPKMPQSTASISDPTVTARAEEIARLSAKARGSQSTLLTGSLGGIGASGSVARKMLLGG